MKRINKSSLFILPILAFSLFSVGSLFNKETVNEAIAAASVNPNHDADTYYNDISTSLEGNDLTKALRALNKERRKSTVGYSAMGTDMSGYFRYTDYDPNQQNLKYNSDGQPYGDYVLSFYSGNHTQHFNREHVWPNSRGGGYIDSDIHMVRPTISSENSARGNAFFVTGKNIKDKSWDPWTEDFSNKEVEKSYRGDAARIIFYAVIADQDARLSLVDKESDETINKTMGKLSDMISWHFENPVSQREMNRNEGAEYLQGNRNPFIDHPEYVCRIWGKYNDATKKLCENDPYAADAPTSITLNTTETTISMFQEFNMSVASVTPEDAGKAVKWTSSNVEVATIDKNGLVKGLSVGDTVITATSTYDNNVAATAIVHVVEPTPTALTDINVTVGKTVMFEGEGTEISVSTIPSLVWPFASFSYKSSDETVLTVDEHGSVYAEGKGEATVTVTATQNEVNVTKDIDFEIKEKPNVGGTVEITRASYTTNSSYAWQNWTAGDISGEGFIFGGNSTNMQFNSSKDYHCVRNTVEFPGDIISIEVKSTDSKKWKLYTSANEIGRDAKSSATDNGEKTVTSSGTKWEVVTAGNRYFYLDYTGSGAAYLKSIAVTYGKSQSQTVLSSISIDSLPDKLVYDKGQSLSTTGLKVTAHYSNDDTKDVTNLVNIDPRVLNTVGTQKVTVSYTEGTITKKATFEVTVNETVTVIPVTGITATSAEITKDLSSAGYIFEVDYTISPSNATNKAVTWSSSNESIATVSDGMVTCLSVGETNITITTVDGGYTATVHLTVTNSGQYVPVQYIDVLEPDLFEGAVINIGETYQIVAEVYPENATNREFEYYSDDETVATVSDDGVITGVGVGSVYLEISVKGEPADITEYVCVEVLGSSSIVKIDSITLSESEKTLKIGDTYQISATVSPEVNDDHLVYNCYDDCVSIDSNGLVTALSEGEAYIFVTNYYGGATAQSLIITVSETYAPVMISSISLDKNEASMTVDESLQLTATISPIPNDDSVSWSSSNPEVATVSENGLIQAKSAGSAVISITNSDNSVTATCVVTVSAKPSGGGESSKGCGGNIVTTSLILSMMSLLGIGLVLINKKKARD